MSSVEWVEKINKQLEELGLDVKDLEAHIVQGNPSIVVFEDTQERTVYHSPEGVWRILTTLHPDEEMDSRDIWELVVQALQSNVFSADDAERVQWNWKDWFYWV